MAAQLPNVLNSSDNSTHSDPTLLESTIPLAPPMDIPITGINAVPIAPPMDTPVTEAGNVPMAPPLASPLGAIPKAFEQSVSITSAVVAIAPYQRVRTPQQIAKEKVKKEILEIARQCKNNLDSMAEQIEIKRQALKKKIGDKLEELNKKLAAIGEKKRLLSQEFEMMQSVLKEKQELITKYQDIHALADPLKLQEAEWQKKIGRFDYTQKMELLEAEVKAVEKSIVEFERWFQQQHGQSVESVELERKLFEECFTEWKVTSVNRRAKVGIKASATPKALVKEGEEELISAQTKFGGKDSIYTEEETLKLALRLLIPAELMESLSTQQSALFGKLSASVDRSIGEKARANLIRDLQTRHADLGIESSDSVRVIVRKILGYDILVAHKKRKEEEAHLQKAEEGAEQTTEAEAFASQNPIAALETVPSQTEQTKSEKIKFVQLPSMGEAQALLAETILKDVRAAVEKLARIIKEADILINVADTHQYQLQKPEQEIELAKILYKNLLNAKEVVGKQAAIAEEKLASIKGSEAFSVAQIALANIQSLIPKAKEQFQQIKATLPLINEVVDGVERANMGYLQAATTALTELNATITEAEEAIKTAQSKDLIEFSTEMSDLTIPLANLLAARQIICAEVEGIKESVKICTSAGNNNAALRVNNIQSILILVGTERKKIKIKLKDVLCETEVRCIQNLNVAREKLHEIEEMIDKARSIIEKLRTQKPCDFETKIGIAEIALKNLQELQQLIGKELATIQRCPRDLQGLTVSSVAILSIDAHLHNARQYLQNIQANEKSLAPSSASKVLASPMRFQLMRVQKQLDLISIPSRLSFDDASSSSSALTLSVQSKGPVLVACSPSEDSSPKRRKASIS